MDGPIRKTTVTLLLIQHLTDVSSEAFDCLQSPFPLEMVK